MIIERKSPVTGQVNRMDLDVTEEGIARWRGGELIQRVFPHLTAAEREFMITGCTADDWEALWADGEEDPL